MSPNPNRHIATSTPKKRPPWRYIGMVVLLALVTEMVAFEITLISSGLPEIATAFDTTSVHWVITILFIVGASTVPIIGRYSDMRGKRRTLMMVMAVYILGSFLCATADTFGVFLVGRALQAFLLAGPVICFSLVRDLLPPKYVPLGVGAVLAGAGMASIAGPILGGALIQKVGYTAPFWFLTFYGMVLLAALFLLPEGRRSPGEALDLAGAGLLASGAVAITLGLEFSRAVAFPMVFAGIGLLVFFGLRARRMEFPLVDVRLLAERPMRMTLFVTACGGIFMNSLSYIFPALLRPTESGAAFGLGLSPIEMGLLLGLPLGLANTASAMFGGIVSKRHGPRKATMMGMTALTMAGLVFATISTGFGGAALVPVASVLTGAGLGLFLSGTANLVVEAVPSVKHGASAGMKFTWESLAGGIGVAAVAALLRSSLVEKISTSEAEQEIVAYTSAGLVTGFLALSFVALLGLALAFTMQHGREPASGGALEEEAVPAH